MPSRWILLLALLPLACGGGDAVDLEGSGEPVAPLPRTPYDLLLTLGPLEPAPSVYHLADGLVIEMLAHGGGDIVERGDRVWVHVDVKIAATGQVVDSTRQRGKAIEFDVGRSSLIKGLDRAVLGLRIGAGARVSVPAALAYGDKGDGGAIGPNTDLELVLQVVRVR